MNQQSLAVLASLTLVHSTVLHAQSVNWLHSATVAYQLNPDLIKHLVSPAPDGAVNIARMDSVTQPYGVDAYGRYVIELRNMQGLVQWSIPLRDKVLVQSMATDPDGVVYVGGMFMEDMAVEEDTLLVAGGQFDTHPFLMAIDNTGHLFWLRDLYPDYPNASMIPFINVDPNHLGWYSVGDFLTTSLVEFNGVGQDLQTRVIEGAKLIGGFDFDPQNNMFVSGSTGSGPPFTFGGQSWTVTESYAMFVLRMDPAGNANWVHFMHDQTFQRPCVVADENGNAFVSGELLDSASFGGIHFHGPDWIYDMFITKVDGEGNFLWGAESAPPGGPLTGDFERSAGTCVATGPGGRAYLLGRVRGSVDWGNGVVPNIITLGASAESVVCFDADGTARWQVVGQITGYASPQSICVDAEGVIHCGTHASGAFELGGITVDAGGQQAAIAQLQDDLNTGVTDLRSTTGLVAFPNPAHGTINVMNHADRTFAAELIDAQGRCLRSLRLSNGMNTIDLTGLDAGIYMLHRMDGASVRVVKE